MGRSNACVCVLGVLLAASLVLVAVLAVLVLRGSQQSAANNGNPYGTKIKADLAFDQMIRNDLMSSISTSAIRENLLKLTKQVHLAGSAENLHLGDMLKLYYQGFMSPDPANNLIEVNVHEYDVLLGYPDYANPNTLHVRDINSADWTMLSSGKGTRLGPPEAQQQQADPRALVWFFAYSPSGEVTGPLVYGGFGSAQELDFIESQGIHINGSIVLVKGGAGNWELERRGALAVVGFIDPQIDRYDVPGNLPKNFTFPNSVFMPPTAVQRFALKNNAKLDFLFGDMLTEHYPSKPYVHRELDYNKLQLKGIVPSVPTTIVSMGAGSAIFNSMDGVIAPPFLGGKLPGVTYRVNAPGKIYKLKVGSVNDNRRRIKNICSYIRGSAEPDHQIIMSNHYDAETFGAFDPNSGTAITMEIVRVLMKAMKEHNWRPRRTLVFCHWDAQEYGMVGSMEWVEEFLKVLDGRAVAMLNVDIGDGGNLTMVGYGVPLLYQTLWDAAKLVRNPNQGEIQEGRPTVYDSWLRYFPNQILAGKPWVGNPIFYSDDYPFTSFAGVASTVHMFVNGKVCGGFPCYGVFHTMYDIEWAVENLVDKEFHVNLAMGQVWLEMARSLADSVAIPFNVRHYVPIMRSFYTQMDGFLRVQNMTTPNRIPDYDLTMSRLAEAILRFETQAISLQQIVNGVNSGVTALTLRQVQMVNQRLVELERAFVNPRGMYTNRTTDRHIFFSAPVHQLPFQTFPAILDTTVNFQMAFAQGQQKMAEFWLKQLRASITDIQYSIESAILVLQVDGFNLG